MWIWPFIRNERTLSIPFWNGNSIHFGPEYKEIIFNEIGTVQCTQWITTKRYESEIVCIHCPYSGHPKIANISNSLNEIWTSYIYVSLFGVPLPQLVLCYKSLRLNYAFVFVFFLSLSFHSPFVVILFSKRHKIILIF